MESKMLTLFVLLATVTGLVQAQQKTNGAAEKETVFCFSAKSNGAVFTGNDNAVNFVTTNPMTVEQSLSTEQSEQKLQSTLHDNAETTAVVSTSQNKPSPYYLGFSGGLSFGRTTFASFAMDETHPGFNLGVLGGYKINKRLSAEISLDYTRMQNEALTSDVNTLVVKYPESYSLNVDDMSVTKIAGEVSHSFTYSSKEVGTLGTSYIIAATGTTKTVMDITATMTSGGATNSKAVTAIPFECNYRTNIYGAYSNLYNSTLSVTCNTQWETTNKEVTFPVTPQVGNFFYSDKTYSTDLKTNKTVIGIVFWVDPTDPTKGKIISLDESYLVWNQDNITIPGTESKTDGAANTATFTSYSDYLTKFPCVACSASYFPGIP